MTTAFRNQSCLIATAPFLIPIRKYVRQAGFAVGRTEGYIVNIKPRSKEALNAAIR